jgi:Rrf2 family protein
MRELAGGVDLQRPNAVYTPLIEAEVLRMQLPIKAHYAALAMLALAVDQQSNQLLAARTIAKQQGIPSQFLGQILQQLRTAGLIVSVRGACGGFKLARPPSTISLSDIVEAVGCGFPTDSSFSELNPIARAVTDVWLELAELQSNYLRKLTLEELSNRLVPDASEMFYI